MTINQHTLTAYKALNPDDSYPQALTNTFKYFLPSFV